MFPYTSCHRILGATALILALGLASCEGGGPTSSEPLFMLSANELIFSGEEQQPVTITNLGSDPIDWRIETSTASWVNGVPASGHADPHGTDTLRVRINRLAVSRGTHSATLRIGAGGQSRELSVSVHESNPAQSALMPSSLAFTSAQTSGAVEVVNAGGSSLEWALSGPAWVSINPSSGTLNAGGRQRVVLTALPVGLTGGLYQGSLQLSSNGGPAATSLTLDVAATSGLRLDPGTLDFGTSKTQMTFRLVNDGETAANWVAQPSSQWVFLSKTSGSLPPKLSQQLSVEITRANLSQGINQSAIQFTSNIGTATAIVMAGIVPAGGPGGSPASSPKLAVSPVALDFGATTTELVLHIRNDGDLALDWSGDPEGGWITMPLPSGRVAPHSSTPVAVRVQRAGLTLGAHSSFIQITSNGGSAVITVAAAVLPQGSPPPPTTPPPSTPPPSTPPPAEGAALTVSPRSLDFGESATEQILRIKNEGDTVLTWSAQASNAWVSLPTSSGQIAPGTFKDVAVHASRTALSAAGQYASTLQFSSNGGNPAVAIALRVPSTEPPPPPTSGIAKLVVTPTSLDFGEEATDLTLRIKNDGDVLLTWSAQAPSAWLALPVDDGQIAPGASTNIIVRASRSGLSAAGDYLGTVQFSSNGGAATVPVSLSVAVQTPLPPPPPPPGAGGTVNVREYGAWGDGLHDDSAAFKAALNALGSSGGVLYVPAGTYNLKPTAGKPNRGLDLSERSNITVVGDGQTSTSLRMPAAQYQGDTHIVFMLGASSITFRDIALDGNRMSSSFTDEQNHCAEVWRGSTDILFERVLFHNCRGDGIRLLGPITATGPWSERITIRDSRFEDNGRSGVAVQRGVRHLKVLNNTFDRISDQSIDVEPTGDVGGLAPTDILIEDNVIRHTTSTWAVTIGGISSEDTSERITFRNNQVLNGGVAFGKTVGMVVENNRIVGDALHGALRFARNVTNVSITGNVISGPGGGDEGVVQIVSYNGAYPSQIYVRDNKITATAGQSGLFIRDPLGEIEVTGNEVTGKGAGNGIDIVLIAQLGRMRSDFSLEANTIFNFAKGIKLGTSGDPLSGVAIRGNSIDHSQIPATPTIGVLFDKTGPYQSFADVVGNSYGSGIKTGVLVRD